VPGFEILSEAFFVSSCFAYYNSNMSYRVPFNAEVQDDSGSSSGEEDRLSDWASSLGEALQTKSLFSDRTFPTPQAAIEFDTKEHGFSIKEESTRKGLDLYGRMRLINWIRKEVSMSLISTNLKFMDFG
jgi:hypothetical protein